MPVTRESFLKAVMEYEGTPYQHQHRIKDVGVDCIGLLVAPLAELGWDMSYVPANYRRMANEETLLGVLHSSPHAYQIAVSDILPGDILVFYVGPVARHFGIYLGDDEFIHSYYRQSVIVTDFTVWKASLHSCYRLRYDEEQA